MDMFGASLGIDQTGRSYPFSLCAVFPPDRVRDISLIESHFQSVFSILEIAKPRDEVAVMGDFNLSEITWKRPLLYIVAVSILFGPWLCVSNSALCDGSVNRPPLDLFT